MTKIPTHAAVRIEMGRNAMQRKRLFARTLPPLKKAIEANVDEDFEEKYKTNEEERKERKRIRIAEADTRAKTEAERWDEERGWKTPTIYDDGTELTRAFLRRGGIREERKPEESAFERIKRNIGKNEAMMMGLLSV